MLETGSVGGHEALGWLVERLGADDRVDRLAALVRMPRAVWPGGSSTIRHSEGDLL